MLVELIFASLMNAVNLAMLINETRRAAKRSMPTRGLAGDSRLTLDYCAELVTNAFRLTPSARRKDAPEDSLLAGGSTACLLHFNGPSKHFWRTRLT